MLKERHKLKLVNQSGYFLYGNHTQPMGDVFTPLTMVSPYRFYAIAGQANWGIPFIGKHLVRYGGLPVGENLQESAKLIQAIKTLIHQKRSLPSIRRPMFGLTTLKFALSLTLACTSLCN